MRWVVSALRASPTRFRARQSLLCYALMGLMFLLWMAPPTQMPGLAAFALLFGTLRRRIVALAPAMQTDFGARHVSGIMAPTPVPASATSSGPLAAGIAFDLSASYTLPLATGAGTNVLPVPWPLALPRLR